MKLCAISLYSTAMFRQIELIFFWTLACVEFPGNNVCISTSQWSENYLFINVLFYKGNSFLEEKVGFSVLVLYMYVDSYVEPHLSFKSSGKTSQKH